MGRKRPLANINAQDYKLRTQAERQAVNFVVQGKKQNKTNTYVPTYLLTYLHLTLADNSDNLKRMNYLVGYY